MKRTNQISWNLFHFLALILVCMLCVYSAPALAADADEDGFDSTVDCDDANPNIQLDQPAFRQEGQT